MGFASIKIGNYSVLADMDALLKGTDTSGWKEDEILEEKEVALARLFGMESHDIWSRSSIKDGAGKVDKKVSATIGIFAPSIGNYSALQQATYSIPDMIVILKDNKIVPDVENGYKLVRAMEHANGNGITGNRKHYHSLEESGKDVSRNAVYKMKCHR